MGLHHGKSDFPPAVPTGENGVAFNLQTPDRAVRIFNRLINKYNKPIITFKECAMDKPKNVACDNCEHRIQGERNYCAKLRVPADNWRFCKSYKERKGTKVNGNEHDQGNNT